MAEAEVLFKRFGIRSVTMDDIAKSLHISKKTLYLYFANKAEIVHAASLRYFEDERARTDAIIAEAKDPVHGVLLVVEASSKGLREMPSHMVYDVKKFYPESWKLFDEFKAEYLQRILLKNLQDGVAAGLYRKDMDLELVALMRMVQIESSINPGYFPPDKFTFEHVQVEQLRMFLHGIVTMKGKKLIYQYLNQPEDE